MKVCLLIFFSSKDIFGFFNKKKVVNTCLTRFSWSTAFWQSMQLSLTVVTVISPHHLIYFDIFFLSGWHVCSGLAWNCFSFLSFFSISFFLGLRAGIYNFFIESLFSYLQLFYLHWLFLIVFYFWFYNFQKVAIIYELDWFIGKAGPCMLSTC
jgi:hypothetical protein